MKEYILSSIACFLTVTSIEIEKRHVHSTRHRHPKTTCRRPVVGGGMLDASLLRPGTHFRREPRWSLWTLPGRLVSYLAFICEACFFFPTPSYVFILTAFILRTIDSNFTCSDNDDDCAGKLVCFQRTGDVNDVPGCAVGTEGVVTDVDYCISLDPIISDEADAQPKPTGVMGETSTCIDGFGCLEYIAQGKDANSGKTFGHCQGHCFSGSDCSGDFKCVLRSANGDEFDSKLRKFGCAGDSLDEVNYCVDASKKLEGFDLITFEEATAPTTDRPTWSPTNMPVVPTTSQPTKKGPTPKPTPRPTGAPTRAADARQQARRWTDVMTADALDNTVKQDITRQPVKVEQMYFAAQVAGEFNPFLISDAPTRSPTLYNVYPDNLPPEDPEQGYFDYSVRDGSEYDSGKGPESWGRLRDGTASLEGVYWSEFDDYIKHDTSTNMCGSKSNRQSPIDVTNKIATKQCFEFHQIRHKSGNFPVSGRKVEKQILPSKLRLHFPRDGFPDGDESFRDQDGFEDGTFGPSADMPKRWGE